MKGVIYTKAIQMGCKCNFTGVVVAVVVDDALAVAMCRCCKWTGREEVEREGERGLKFTLSLRGGKHSENSEWERQEVSWEVSCHSDCLKCLRESELT